MEYINKCAIIPHSADNISDHLPISLEMNVSVPTVCKKELLDEVQLYPKGKWSNIALQSLYMSEVEKGLNKINLGPPLNLSKCNAAYYINKRCKSLCEKLHSSVENCMQKSATRKGQINNKQWWNRDCTLAKRQNGLFYYIWKESCRPSSGTIYETYKAAKRKYRKTCKKAMDNIITIPYKTLDYLHKSKNSKQFWNVIRKSKTFTSNSNAITNTDLSNHFREKMSSSARTTEYIRNAEM